MSDSKNNKNVLVIGAGAAGLAAATDLAESGWTVTVLEARNRIGGRILTFHDQKSIAPIELGAEFVHGKPPEILESAKEAGLTLTDVQERHWYFRDEMIHDSKEFFSKLNQVMDSMKKIGEKDFSFQYFIESQKLPADAVKMARLYVQGFHAAPADRISVKSLNRINEAADAIDGDQMFRFAGGYERIAQWFYEKALSHGAYFQFNANVAEIRWSRRSVEAITQQNKFRSSYAVITIPLPALQTDAIRFNPALAEKQKAAGRLAMGQTVKTNFVFREPFWENLKLHGANGEESLFDFAFLHAGEEAVPTWWTQLPVRAPILVGWTGGPNAERLLQNEDEKIFDAALDSLHHIFAIPRKQIDNLLEASYMHNWQADPFACGAYSYIPVGAIDAPAQLAKPIEGTLFFAGEATDTQGHTGTVHGAIQTGKRAAKELMGSVG